MTGGKRINSVRDLEVYWLAFETAMKIYDMSKEFPAEERHEGRVMAVVRPSS